MPREFVRTLLALDPSITYMLEVLQLQVAATHLVAYSRSPLGLRLYLTIRTGLDAHIPSLYLTTRCPEDSVRLAPRCGRLGWSRLDQE